MVKRWAVIIDWWWRKYSFCIGSGCKGEAIFYDLRECIYSGIKVVETKFSNAIYVEGRVMDIVYYYYFLPRQLYGKSLKVSYGGQIKRDKFELTC